MNRKSDFISETITQNQGGLATPGRKTLVFLGLTFAFSSIFYYLSILGSHYTYSLYLMWCPGISALLTQWIFHRSLKGLGWSGTKFKYLLLSYGLPILYGIVVYGLVWLTGAGRFIPFERANQVASAFNIAISSPTLLLIVYTLGMGTVGVVINGLAAFGEEIGWRGLLVPELYKATSFTNTALISGLIWAAWHAPIILFSDYNAGVSTGFGLLCFTVMVTGSSFAYAWLRLKSGSFWPAVILHASHNAIIQGIFTPLTGDTGVTFYLIDEFGAGLALAAVVMAVLFWRKRADLPQRILPKIKGVIKSAT